MRKASVLGSEEFEQAKYEYLRHVVKDATALLGAMCLASLAALGRTDRVTIADSEILIGNIPNPECPAAVCGIRVYAYPNENSSRDEICVSPNDGSARFYPRCNDTRYRQVGLPDWWEGWGKRITIGFQPWAHYQESNDPIGYDWYWEQHGLCEPLLLNADPNVPGSPETLVAQAIIAALLYLIREQPEPGIPRTDFTQTEREQAWGDLLVPAPIDQFIPTYSLSTTTEPEVA